MKVAFLDRDGVINKDSGYLYKISDFEFTDGCIDGLKRLQKKGYALIVVTNQSGIGRGYYTEDDYQTLTRWYCDELLARGVIVTDVFHCPHSPDVPCDCRKPKPGLFVQAHKKYPEIDFSDSLMIGDKLSDLEAAQAAGVSTLVLVESDNRDKQVSNQALEEKIIHFPSLYSFSESL
ncbi:MAG: D-glycero-beta-D-manno-heptose 1,7-bisphosphate 7-phosphatase [Cellvibrionaceae bacterium]